MPSETTTYNRAFHDEFWRSCTDFSRYNPGARHRRRLLLNVLRHLSFDSLLDLGCGDGELLLFLRSHFPAGVELAGADLSPATVEGNRARLPFATFSVLDLQQAALDRAFGVVVCSEVIEHLDDQAGALAHAARMVAPGGHLLVTCPTGKVHATEQRFGHIRHPTEQELRRSIEQAGLVVLESRSWGFPIYGALKYATNLNPSWALRNFGTTSYSARSKLLCHALYAANFLNWPSSRFGCQLIVVARRAGTSARQDIAP